MRLFPIAVLLLAAACAAPMPPVGPSGPVAGLSPQPDTPALSADVAMRNFTTVVARMEPVVERECRARARGVNCDFNIIIDDRPGQPANAYQTLDPSGRPVLAFTRAMLVDVRNDDELAFVLGHEAAHHIAGHIPRRGQSALAGALVFGTLAAVTGADATAMQTAQDIGATVGSRVYSKDFELEADGLGTILTWRSGYDPERGAAYFGRIPDPGDRFLGSHPPNQSRMLIVQRTLERLRAGDI